MTQDLSYRSKTKLTCAGAVSSKKENECLIPLTLDKITLNAFLSVFPKKRSRERLNTRIKKALTWFH